MEEHLRRLRLEASFRSAVLGDEAAWPCTDVVDFCVANGYVIENSAKAITRRDPGNGILSTPDLTLHTLALTRLRTVIITGSRSV